MDMLFKLCGQSVYPPTHSSTQPSALPSVYPSLLTPIHINTQPPEHPCTHRLPRPSINSIPFPMCVSPDPSFKPAGSRHPRHVAPIPRQLGATWQRRDHGPRSPPQRHVGDECTGVLHSVDSALLHVGGGAKGGRCGRCGWVGGNRDG